MDVRVFHRALIEAAAGLIPVGDGVACAVSGGLDSMVMLHALVTVNEMHERRWRIHVAHLDHGLRSQSAHDARFVAESAKQLNLSSTIDRCDVRALSVERRLTLEHAGRMARYELFQRVAAEQKAIRVAVGHHRDDQAETVLHRILRGTGLRGLGGMAADRPITPGSSVRVVRPMLGFSRQELMSYAQERGIAYHEDHTNADSTAATRNRLRHDVLPLLRSAMNPEVEAALVRLAEQARRANMYLEAAARRALEQVKVTKFPTRITVSAAFLATLPEVIQNEIVFGLLEELGVDIGEVSFERIEAVRHLIAGCGEPKYVELPAGTRVLRAGRSLHFRTATDPDNPNDDQEPA